MQRADGGHQRGVHGEHLLRRQQSIGGHVGADDALQIVLRQLHQQVVAGGAGGEDGVVADDGARARRVVHATHKVDFLLEQEERRGV